MVENNIYTELITLNIIDKDSIVEFYPETRDNENIPILKCEKSGVIFLKDSSHIDENYYTQMNNFSYWGVDDMKKSLTSTYNDDFRRIKMIKKIIKDKVFLDFGCGNGGILKQSKKYTKSLYGVELQENVRKTLIECDFNVFSSIDEILDKQIKFDVITMFHVFEHLTEPLKTLEKLYSILNENGILIVEVPHANDALISYYKCESFKKSTFWSEHLILHTKESINKYLCAASFKNVNTFGVQRYGLFNHIHWMNSGKPGGQKILKELENKSIDKLYSKILDKNNLTDTIVSICKK